MDTNTKEDELHVYCNNCGKEINDGDEYYHDEFLFDVFGYLFCNEMCRDIFINSK